MSEPAKADLSRLSAEEKRNLVLEIARGSGKQARRLGPLSHGQRQMWLLHQLAPSSAAYHLAFLAEIDGDLDPELLQRALERTIARHAALRTTYASYGNQPMQWVHARGVVSLDRVDASGFDQSAIKVEIERRSDQPFDLQQGPLLRVTLFGGTSTPPRLLLVAHHIAVDFRSLELLVTDLLDEYAAAKAGRPFPAPASVTSIEYAQHQLRQLEGESGNTLWEYWRGALAGEIPPLQLPTDFTRPLVQTYRGADERIALPPELVDRLREFSRTQGSTPYVSLLSAFIALLHRLTGQDDVLVGSPVSGRTDPAFSEMIGYVANSVCLRVRVDPELTFTQLLQRVRGTVALALEHQAFPFPLLVERLGLTRDSSRPPLFNVFFVWDEQRTPVARAAEGIALRPLHMAQRGAAFDLTLTAFSIGSTMSLAFQYNKDLFESATVRRLAAQYLRVLEAAVEDPERRVSRLPLLSAQERHMVLETWNETAAEVPAATFPQLFSALAARSPEAIAVQCGDECVTYAELDRQAGEIASALRATGIRSGDVVGIFVERSVGLVAALLGVLRAGAAYLPVDPTYPAERVEFVLRDAGATLVLATRATRDRLPAVESRVLQLDEVPHGQRPLTDMPFAPPDALAYVIYTSGSTGVPKGTEVSHGSLLNLLCAMANRPGLRPEDRLVAVTTVSFDIAALELFLPLLVGARVVIASREDARDPYRLADLISRSGGTVLQATPATWRMLVQAGFRGGPGFKALCGGEALPRDLANDLLERAGSVWNLYGPTETTIWSMVAEVQRSSGVVAIGRPIANTRVYIVDGEFQPVPIGTYGQLLIGGAGVARGYRKRPELTEQRFRPDPFSARKGDRVYLTGDVARYRPDGSVEFAGRNDDQVKINGHRVELGEIDVRLRSHPAVLDALAAVSKRSDGSRLISYVVLRDGALSEPVQRLREHLRRSLPDYMVPAEFVFLPALPRTPNGKINRSALPAPDDAARPFETYVAPRTETERVLARLWAQALGIAQIGIHDNFFDLGGASLHAVTVASEAAAAGLALAPEQLFELPTIAQLAERIGKPAPAPTPGP